MDFQIDNFFWIKLKVKNEIYFSFWIDCGNSNFVPFKKKNFIVFSNTDEAINFILENNIFKSVAEIKSKEVNFFYNFDIILDSFEIDIYESLNNIIECLHLIDDLMYLTKDDFLYDFLIEDNDVMDYKDKIRDKVLWGKRNKFKPLKRSKVKIEKVLNYFFNRVILFS